LCRGGTEQCAAALVSRTAFISLCVVEPGLNILVLLPSQTATPLSPGRGGARAGAAGVRRVCGMSVGPRERCACVRLAFVFITSKASSKRKEYSTGREKRIKANWPPTSALALLVKMAAVAIAATVVHTSFSRQRSGVCRLSSRDPRRSATREGMSLPRQKRSFRSF